LILIFEFSNQSVEFSSTHQFVFIVASIKFFIFYLFHILCFLDPLMKIVKNNSHGVFFRILIEG